jgi:hypothetical protein
LLVRRGDYNLLIRLAVPGGGSRPGAEQGVSRSLGKTPMNSPKIDLSALPDLDTLTGVFGSQINPLQALQSDDTIIVMMVYVYDIIISTNPTLPGG